MMEWCKNTL